MRETYETSLRLPDLIALLLLNPPTIRSVWSDPLTAAKSFPWTYDLGQIQALLGASDLSRDDVESTGKVHCLNCGLAQRLPIERPP
jgi:hypothetical protein